MKSIQTVYPCPNCGVENRPICRYCSNCGNELPSWADKTIYNLFYRKIGDPMYNLMFSGDPILTLEDAKEAAWEEIKPSHGRTEYYIGAYRLTTPREEGIAFIAEEWYRVAHERITEDLGPQMVRITYHEQSLSVPFK